jgi:hypothetical protein
MTKPKTRNVTKEMFVDEEPQVKNSFEEIEQPLEEESSIHEEVANILTLPSLGKLGYPKEVTYRDILVKDEEVLSMATEETYAKVLNRVLKSILNDPPFYEKMSIHDRDYAMIWLWANNYDPIKKMKVTCSHCENVDTHNFDLRTVEVEDIKDDFVDSLEIPLKTGGRVTVRLPTVEDELSAEEYTRKNKNHSYQYVLLAHTIKIPKVMKFSEKLEWIGENMTAQEIGYVKNYHKYFKFGVNSLAEYKCTACGEVTQDFIPFQAEDILLPSTIGDFRKFLPTK